MDYLLIWLVLVNIFAFFCFGLDKFLAKKDARRISERTLIGAALLGGCLGALFGMKAFRHKTLHKKFSIGLPLICLGWLGLLILLLIKLPVFG